MWILNRPVWVSKACQIFLIPSSSFGTPLNPSKCRELGSVPRLLLLPLFSYLGPRLGPVRSWEYVNWWLLCCNPLVVIDGYFINGYYWLLYNKLLFVIICYIITIGDYYIINYCLIFYVTIIVYWQLLYYKVFQIIFHRFLFSILSFFTLGHYILF